MRKQKLKLIWTCSDYVKHTHRWFWTAYVCGRIQRVEVFLRGGWPRGIWINARSKLKIL